MLRVLFLRRQRVGGIATYTEVLRHRLEMEGVDVVIDDATGWIPNETGFRVDRKVSRALRDAVRGFDLVHAFGYRAAWACSEAFYVKQPWLYTAYDMPKTTMAALVDRLNAARRGICSSTAVKRELDGGDTLHLEVITPGVYVPDETRTTEEARLALGLDADERVVLGFGRLVPERGFDALRNAAAELVRDTDKVSVVIVGEGPEASRLGGEGCRVVTGEFDKWLWLQAAEIVVVPSRRAGFSMVAAEAMMLGKPVLVRRTGGLADMGIENVSLEVFDEDDDLLFVLLELLNSPIHLDSVGEAGRYRAEDRFDLGKCVNKHVNLYRDLTSR